MRHIFAANFSEFYPRLNWNVKSVLAPHAWPQLLSACGYLLLFVVAMRKRIPDPRLQAWLLLVPIWVVFMFSYGILIETRVFGELIPLVVCTTELIAEELLVVRMRQRTRGAREEAVVRSVSPISVWTAEWQPETSASPLRQRTAGLQRP